MQEGICIGKYRLWPFSGVIDGLMAGMNSISPASQGVWSIGLGSSSNLGNEIAAKTLAGSGDGIGNKSDGHGSSLTSGL